MPNILRNPKLDYLLQQSSLIVPVLSQINPLYAVSPYNFEIYINVILPPPQGHSRGTSLPYISRKTYVHCPSTYACHMPHPSHFNRYYEPE